MEIKWPRSQRYYFKHKEQIKLWKKVYRAKNRSKINEYKRKYYAINKDKNRNGRLKQDYGITLQEYNELCKKQSNICPICLMKQELLVVDHDHKTGKVRGLLCSSCNKALGFLKDNTGLLERAIGYLKS